MQRVKDFLCAAACTSLGFGYSPIIPGTVGTIPSVILFILIALYVALEHQTLVIATVLILACLLSILLAPWAERQWDRKDPRRFVLDEVAGYFFTVLLVWPFVATQEPTIIIIFTGLAFVATRFFDIVKPFPARRLEKLPQGWGILLDDLAASLYAAATLHVIFHLPTYIQQYARHLIYMTN
jgi:phosphatidylglycerophosphatase A